MFGDSSQEVFSAVAFLRARVTTSSGPQTELAFVLGKARVAPMNVMTVPKLELQAALLAARLKPDICRALTVHISKFFMWTDSTTVYQWLNSTSKQPIIVANRVCEILEHTNVNKRNHIASSDNPADVGTRDMSAEVLQSSSWVRGSDFLRTKQFTFEPSTEVVNTSRPSTGQQQPSKTTTLSSVTDVKGLLQVTELKLTNSSGTSTTALVLCDTACSNSWMSDSLGARLGLQGTALKLTVNGINKEELIDTKVFQLTVTPHKDLDFEAFTVRPYVRETLNVGSDIIDVKSMQETYPHLAVLDPVKYSYGNIEMIPGQDVYHAIRPLEYFAADEKCSPFAVRLPIGWVLSGPLPSSSSLVSTCFKANVEKDYEIACQVKSWYDMESYGAYKQVDPRSTANACAQEIIETITIHNGQRYDVGMLWADD